LVLPHLPSGLISEAVAVNHRACLAEMSWGIDPPPESRKYRTAAGLSVSEEEEEAAMGMA